MFCPYGSVQRWELAVWFVRVHDGANDAPHITNYTLQDVDPDSSDPQERFWAPFAQRLRDLQITRACRYGSDYFCPEDPVSRGQLASFIVRAFDPPTQTRTHRAGVHRHRRQHPPERH